MKKKRLSILGIFALVGGFMMYQEMQKKAEELIPRSVLFGNPDKRAVSLSPDGQKIAYLAPVEGVMNIWVQDLSDPKSARSVTHNKDRGIAGFSWTYDTQYLLYVIDQGGDENWNLHRVDLKTGEDKTLTHEKKVQTQVLKLSPLHPSKVMIGLNNRDPRYHDIYQLDLKTGEMSLIYQNDSFSGFEFDAHLNLCFGAHSTEGGALAFAQNTGTNKEPVWKEFLEFSRSEKGNSGLLYVDPFGAFSYWLDSRGRDKAVLKKIHLKTREETVLASMERVDINGARFSLKTGRPFIASGTYDKSKMILLDESFSDVFEAAKSKHEGSEFMLFSDLDHKIWLIGYLSDQGPIRYYIYDRESKTFAYLFSHKKDLEAYELNPMQFVEIKARDGVVLPSYLTLPKGYDLSGQKGKVPLVVNVHGGPWARDAWGYDPFVQWLSNRGYAVLQVNYRGSTGFGKEFVEKSFGEWGAKMHDDILDAVNWAIQQGVADPKKVAIFGGSYGGYEALWAMTQNPDIFTMGVSLVGPSNLETLIHSLPPYWASEYEWFVRAVGGDPKTPEGRKFLKERSPLTYANQIKTPLLIAQGANDVRVKKEESEQIVAALKEKNIPATYLFYPNEGHGLVRPEDRLYFVAVLEQMLSKVLGGDAEPLRNEKRSATVDIRENSLGLSLGE